MKSWKKITLTVLAVVLLGGAIFAVPTLWGKPWKIEHFYTRVFAEMALRHPMMLSNLRILEPMGITFHNAKLDDFSVAADEREADWTKAQFAMLHEYERDAQADKLSYDVFEHYSQLQVDGIPFMFHNYPVNQMFGMQSNLPDFMINTHQINDLEGAEDYITRLEQFPRAFEQLLEGLKLREQKGIEPPRFVMTKVLAEMRNFITPAPAEHILASHFAKEIAEGAKLDESAQKGLNEKVLTVLKGKVYPAYQTLIDYWTEREKVATTDDGVWKLPDGDKYYAWQLRRHTTTALSAEEVHNLGIEQVALLKEEMSQILQGEGYDTSDFAAVMQQVHGEERFLYPDNDDGRAAIIADYQKIIDEIDAAMEPMFNIRPDAKVKVERVPVFKEKTAPGAYYQSAPMDGSRPGTFFANLRDVKETPKFGMRTLAYHEAVPGHHYQISIARELQGVPFFRRIVSFTSYIEGWALYAEHVAAENGFQEDPFDRLGYLTAQMFRAVRLVVDTGLHHKRWTREEAIQYMRDNTGMPEGDVVSEIERYIVMPGQATAYKVGQLEILRIREKAKKALGERFDLPGFHDVVLKNGALPLTILERLVDEWAKSEK